MCGICGLVTAQSVGEREQRANAMVETLRFRGPNARGMWSDIHVPISLGHTRLSILDISEAGAQPMVSASGRWVVTYNGEIYNFRAIRSQLEDQGARFRGTSDTEVLIEAISRWGIRETLEQVNGMFAFAAWDRESKTLNLCRDRIGIKPLYYGFLKKEFLFSSELKAIRAAGVVLEVNRTAVAEFLRCSYVPAPLSIYTGIYKLPPGHLLTIAEDALIAGQLPDPEPFWKLSDSALHPDRQEGGDQRSVVKQALADAVARRMVADVPLGAFLSGGVDSSLIVALMQHQSPTPIKTFTIGFEEAAYNEAEDARSVARYLGTDHTELILRPHDALAIIPELASVYDEPFADSSQIPTLLVSTLAAEHVTVCLSGDGGDELFCGYNRYIWGARIWNWIRFLPVSLRHVLSRTLQRVPPANWDRLFTLCAPMLPDSMNVKLPAEKVAKLCKVLDAPTFISMYSQLVTHWDTSIVRDTPLSESLSAPRGHERDIFDLLTPTEQMMFLDSVSYLPDDLLVKVDRASMARSLEVRVPFLDHTLVELVWRLPPDLRTAIQNGRGKLLLREILETMLPQDIFERPKMGFSVPIGTWLRGPLRDWAEHLLDEKRLESQGLLDVGPVREKWGQHLSLAANNQYYLWDILMLQSWLEGEGSNA